MAEVLNADVVVVGSGVAGAIIAAKLAASGVKVLILEAGPRVNRGAAFQRFRRSRTKSSMSPYENVAHAPSPDSEKPGAYYVLSGSTPFEALYVRAVGGSTWHWGGNASRLHPNDFKMRSKYGVALDWPIEYASMLPHYEQAEHELGVAGDPETCLIPAPRGAFPMPPIPMTYNDLVVAKASAPLGLTLKPTPQARNSMAFDGRPPCCGSATCVPMCPIGAKYDGAVHVKKAETAGATLVENAVVHRVEIGPNRKVTSVAFLRPDRTEVTVRGKIFVIAAHAIETPKLLLMSHSEATPNGVANGSGLVGRNLMAHIQVGYVGLAAEPVYPYRGPVETAGFAEWRDGAFRSDHAAMGTGNSNQGWVRATGPMLRSTELIAKGGLVGEALRKTLAQQSLHEVAIGGSAEILPDPDNRVTLDEQKDGIGLPRPHINFSIGDYTKKSLTLGQERHMQIMKALGCTSILDGGPHVNTSIIGGTARMGKDAKTSVVDTDLRSHDHANLFVVGSAVFPTMGISPPTLTIAALALRAAAKIKLDLAHA